MFRKLLYEIWYNVQESNEQCKKKGEHPDCLQAGMIGLLFIGRKPVNEGNRRFSE